MKIPCEVRLNDLAIEYLMNLVAQGFYSESWELKMKLLCAFGDSLGRIMTDVFNEELKEHIKGDKNGK